MRLPGRNKARRPERPTSSSTSSSISARTKIGADLVNPETGDVVGRIETTVGDLARGGFLVGLEVDDA